MAQHSDFFVRVTEIILRQFCRLDETNIGQLAELLQNLITLEGAKYLEVVDSVANEYAIPEV